MIPIINAYVCGRQEVCFGGVEATEFQVYEESRHPIRLLDLTPPRTNCKLPAAPTYSLQRVPGEAGLAEIRDGYLTVVPSLAKGDIKLTVSCSLGGAQLSRQLSVSLIASRVRLPAAPATVARRIVPGFVKGEEVLLTWAVVERGTPATLDSSNMSSSYRLALDKHDFTTDLVNATLLLVKLTWSKNSTEKYVKVGTRISTCNEPQKKKCKKDPKECTRILGDCMLVLWTEVEAVPGAPWPSYPRSELRVTPSPFARIAQPPWNRTDPRQAGLERSLRFWAALPELLESPFEVTERQGILYLPDWSVQDLQHTYLQPGSLVEWSVNGSQAGLAWLDIAVLNVTCPDWDLCSEAKSEKSCTRPCRIGASPLLRGRCEWRNNTNLGMPSRSYATCSPGLAYCPDKVCDPLEQLYRGLCAQDCTVYDVQLGQRDDDSEGILRGIGVCSCDVTGKCHCGTETGDEVVARGRGGAPRGPPGAEGPLAPPKHTAVHLVEKEESRCNGECIGVIVFVAAVVATIISAAVYISASRTCIIRKKGQGSAEYSGHALLPIGPTEIRTTTPVADALMHHHEIDPKWEVSRSKLSVEECLGEGEFGRVLRATASDLPNYSGYVTVAVKTLKDNAGTSELEDLMSEYQLLKEVSHPNVIKLLGACTTPGAPVYIIIEFCALGSLRAFLRRHRNIKANNDHFCFQNLEEITPRDILSFAWQISKGMSYLTEIKLVHRDLAARNILLATGKVCKISDFGLTRDVYEDDTYLKKSRGRVPVKWMALESLSDHVYTSKSDVWSFGVVLWELVTFGSSPYPGVVVQNLYHLLKGGYRMQQPSNCSQQLYDIMTECWSASPPDRPSFSMLVNKFERMLEEGADYLDCNVQMVTNPSYFNEVDERVPPGANEMDIRFEMDLENKADTETDSTRYENDSVNKETSYDIPKPISYIIMSDLLSKEEQR